MRLARRPLGRGVRRQHSMRIMVLAGLVPATHDWRDPKNPVLVRSAIMDVDLADTGESGKHRTMKPDLQPDWLVACSECGAASGLKCLTPGGQPMNRGHLLRLFENELARQSDAISPQAHAAKRRPAN